MSHTAIEDVGMTLIDLLRKQMDTLIPGNSIALESPGEIEEKDGVQLSLFLYQVLENIYSMQRIDSAHVLENIYSMQKKDTGKPRSLPLSLDLFYMLTSHPSSQIPDRTERTREAHMILGRAMQILHDNPVLTVPVLKGSLAANIKELRITLNPNSLNDVTSIWTTIGKPLRPSVCYLVTPVIISSSQR